MARPRKYLWGNTLTTHQAVSAILDNEWIMFNHKPMHPSWARSWPLNLIDAASRGQRLRAACINPEWKAKETQ